MPSTWLICMDEIGQWHTGAMTDEEDPTHDTLRRFALWGSLMAGGAGVEWYFGARHPHNDLNSEDWRQRAELWRQTRVGLDFFERHLPYWEMQPADDLTDGANDFCLAKQGSVYAIFTPKSDEAFRPIQLDLGSSRGNFQVRWFDPVQGGSLRKGSLESLSGPGSREVGRPPTDGNQDWVILVVATDRARQMRTTNEDDK